LRFLCVKNDIEKPIPNLRNFILFLWNDFEEWLDGFFSMIDIAFEKFHGKGIIDIKVVHEIVVVFHGVYPIANEKAYEEHT
jgi:hypothetical protein